MSLWRLFGQTGSCYEPYKKTTGELSIATPLILKLFATRIGADTEDETRSFIQRSVSGRKEVPRRDYSLAILLETESELIGSCGIYLTDSGNREGHIGYTLNRKFWRQGYGTETAKALLEFGFGELNLHRIFATCDQANVASVHILEKVGMRREGHLRENKWIRGEWRDSLLYAILDYEWKRSGI